MPRSPTLRRAGDYFLQATHTQRSETTSRSNGDRRRRVSRDAQVEPALGGRRCCDCVAFAGAGAAGGRVAVVVQKRTGRREGSRDLEMECGFKRGPECRVSGAKVCKVECGGRSWREEWNRREDAKTNEVPTL